MERLSPLYAGFLRWGSFLFPKLSALAESISDVFGKSIGTNPNMPVPIRMCIVTPNVMKIVSLLYNTSLETRMNPRLLHVTFF